MWNSIVNWRLENGTPPGTPRTPPLRIPTAQSPMPAFFFLGSPETPQPPTPESWPTDCPSTSRYSVSSFKIPGSREAPTFPDEQKNVRQQTPSGLSHWLYHNMLRRDSRSSNDSSYVDNPFRGQPVQPSCKRGPRYNQQDRTPSNFHDNAWINPHIWPTGTSVKAPKYLTTTGIRVEPHQIPRLWKIRIPERYADQPVVDAQSTTAHSSDWASLGSAPPTGEVSFQVKFDENPPILGWNALNHDIKTLEQNHHSLAITWSPSSYRDDPGGRMGGRIFKSLFDLLARQIDVRPTPLAAFKRISINVPERLEDADIVPITGPERTAEEQEVINANRIDLDSASNLKEFLFQGSHLFLAEKLLNLPGWRLTLLSITCCKISVNDTLELLQACSRLKDVTVGNVCAEADCELGNRFHLKPGAELSSELRSFIITSYVDVTGIVGLLTWDGIPTITVNILDDGVAGQNWEACFSRIPMGALLIMNGNFPQATMESLQSNIPNAVFGT
ncbi:hypothetical protein M413DRAFT_32631 [Hebeloma cylindrosporum]|uniref:Uncharacterized protein n=1 Tax=Hebeloma cylindrosporum TaxID=76867 RepID=A0A0C2XBF1_HEBCY|nr:hypothetical protein M413DRAFT_32631 [Hebeloma cylindrosporum h7]